MVRMRNSETWGREEFVVDDGNENNGRLVYSVKSTGKLEAFTEGRWLIFRDAYLSFVGNHAIINPNPTPITKALNEVPLRGVDDGA